VSEFSCGFSVLSTLLEKFYGIEVSQDFLIDSYSKNILEEKRGISFLDMKKIAQQYNFVVKGYKVNFQALEEVMEVSKVPVIVHLLMNGDIRSGHYVLLINKKENSFLVFDPAFGEFYINGNNLSRKMSGNILVIVPSENEDTFEERLERAEKKKKALADKNYIWEKVRNYEIQK
jgi:predicted double-glycine peptidase